MEPIPDEDKTVIEYAAVASVWDDDAEQWVKIQFSEDEDQRPYYGRKKLEADIAEFRKTNDVRWVEYWERQVESRRVNTVVFVGR